MLTDGNAQVVKPACKKHADAKRTALSLDGAARIFFYLFLLIKPLYLLSSGSLQLGDICLLLAFACCLTSRRANFKIERIDLLMIGFVSSVIVIDGWYFCMYGDTSFLVYAMYYVFNLFAILLFRYLYEDRDFLRACCRCLRIALIIQFLIYVFGFGRWYDAARYMGTFNDPNQMGFFVLSSFAFILIANEKCGFKNRLVDDFCAIALILLTSSTGMMLGMVLIYCAKAFKFVRKDDVRHAILALISFCVLLSTALVVVSLIGSGGGIAGLETMIDRIQGKIDKLFSGGEIAGQSSFLIDRGLDKVAAYPELIFFGAGEGNWGRFDLAYTNMNEVHSTWIGLLFYYGLIPFFILVAWIVGNFRHGRNSTYVYLVYFALFAETMTLANERQPMLWMLLTLAALTAVEVGGTIRENAEKSPSCKRIGARAKNKKGARRV